MYRSGPRALRFKKFVPTHVREKKLLDVLSKPEALFESNIVVPEQKQRAAIYAQCIELQKALLRERLQWIMDPDVQQMFGNQEAEGSYFPLYNDNVSVAKVTNLGQGHYYCCISFLPLTHGRTVQNYSSCDFDMGNNAFNFHDQRPIENTGKYQNLFLIEMKKQHPNSEWEIFAEMSFDVLNYIVDSTNSNFAKVSKQREFYNRNEISVNGGIMNHHRCRYMVCFKPKTRQMIKGLAVQHVNATVEIMSITFDPKTEVQREGDKIKNMNMLESMMNRSDGKPTSVVICQENTVTLQFFLENNTTVESTRENAFRVAFVNAGNDSKKNNDGAVIWNFGSMDINSTSHAFTTHINNYNDDGHKYNFMQSKSNIASENTVINVYSALKQHLQNRLYGINDQRSENSADLNMLLRGMNREYPENTFYLPCSVFSPLVGLICTGNIRSPCFERQKTHDVMVFCAMGTRYLTNNVVSIFIPEPMRLANEVESNHLKIMSVGDELTPVDDDLSHDLDIDQILDLASRPSMWDETI